MVLDCEGMLSRHERDEADEAERSSSGSLALVDPHVADARHAGKDLRQVGARETLREMGDMQMGSRFRHRYLASVVCGRRPRPRTFAPVRRGAFSSGEKRLCLLILDHRRRRALLRKVDDLDSGRRLPVWLMQPRRLGRPGRQTSPAFRIRVHAGSTQQELRNGRAMQLLVPQDGILGRKRW